MDLVCFQGTDKENWPQINALINHGDWGRVFIIKNKIAEDFNLGEKCKVILIDSSIPLIELKEDIVKKLKTLLGKDFEVALSLASGAGKEHMALISALLIIPVGLRLVAFTKKGVEFIS